MSANTPIVPNWQIEFNQRVQTFADSIGVPPAVVLKALADYGADGTTAQSLDIIDSEEALPMSELFEMFVDSKLTQKGKLRIGVAHLRGKTCLQEASPTTNGEVSEIASAIKDMIASNRPKSDWSDDELLRAYNDDSKEIWDILRQRSHGRPFIIFNPDGTVNVDVSRKLLSIARRQPTASRHQVGGKLVHVFRAGEFLERALEESPFCRGVALVDGYCHETDTHWSEVSDEARLICHLHYFKVETAKLSKREMKQIARKAIDLDLLRDDLSEAALLYDELKAQDALPKLRVMSATAKEIAQKSVRDTGF